MKWDLMNLRRHLAESVRVVESQLSQLEGRAAPLVDPREPVDLRELLECMKLCSRLTTTVLDRHTR